MKKRRIIKYDSFGFSQFTLYISPGIYDTSLTNVSLAIDNLNNIFYSHNYSTTFSVSNSDNSIFATINNLVGVNIIKYIAPLSLILDDPNNDGTTKYIISISSLPAIIETNTENFIISCLEKIGLTWSENSSPPKWIIKYRYNPNL